MKQTSLNEFLSAEGISCVSEDFYSMSAGMVRVQINLEATSSKKYIHKVVVANNIALTLERKKNKYFLTVFSNGDTFPRVETTALNAAKALLSLYTSIFQTIILCSHTEVIPFHRWILNIDKDFLIFLVESTKLIENEDSENALSLLPSWVHDLVENEPMEPAG